MIDEKVPIEEISCPEFLFECDDKCREYCPNHIEKVKMDHTDTCFHCGKEIPMETTAIIRNDNLYHYTNEKGHPHEECVKACKNAWKIEKKEVGK